MKNLFKLCIVLLGIFIIFSACDSDYYLDKDQFEKEWENWKKLNIQNYSFTILNGMNRNNNSFLNSRSLSAPPPQEYIEKWKVIVKNSVMESFEYFNIIPLYDSNNGYNIIIPDNKRTPIYTSISNMYEELNRIYFKSISKTKLNLKFDKDLHFITQQHHCENNDDGYCNGNTTRLIIDFKILD